MSAGSAAPAVVEGVWPRSPRWPDFFIVGAPKCGTTAMYHYLRLHPGIFMPFRKEPLYFGSDVVHRYGRPSEDEYLALFRDARPDQLIGEASAWYLHSTRSAREIHDACPDARIIVMLRNPVDMMHALHSELLFDMHEEITDFAEALAAELDRREGRRLPPGPLRVENLFYRESARFAEQLERYFDVFGRERVHVIIYDDFRRDTRATYRAVLRFLGADDSFEPDFAVVNESRRPRSSALQRLAFDPPGPILRLAPLLRRNRLIHGARAALLRWNSRRAPRQPMDPVLRRQLLAEFEPEVRRLGELIGRDLSHWSRG